MKVSKKMTFDAAHFLHVPSWSREQNLATFHKCSKFKKDGRETPHGHTYFLEVTVDGKVDPVTGYVIDFKELKKIVNDVIELLDHDCINDLPYFKDKTATAENIVQFLWSQIAPLVNTSTRRLSELKLWETPDSCATFSGDRPRVEIPEPVVTYINK